MTLSADDAMILRTATLSLDEMYQELGEVLLGNGQGLGGRDGDESRRFGHHWLNQKSNELIKVVCTSDLRNLVRDGGLDDLAAVAAVLYGAYPDTAVVVLVAAIVCRRGLASVCALYDQ